MTRRDLLRWTTAGVATSLVPYGYAACDTNWLSLESFEYNLPLWDVPNFKVAIVSDMHLNRPEHLELAKEAAEWALEAKPDLIVLPGDFTNTSDHLQIKMIHEFLACFHDAKCPVLATLGNHDWNTRYPNKVIQCFEGTNIRLLRNEIVDLNGVSIAGLDDAIARRHRPDVIVPGAQAKSLITLLHEPDYVDELPSHVSLMIAGHSHGGQICLPFGVPLHTPYGGRKYVEGFFSDTKVPLFVSRGIGVTGMPVRMFCRPQVAIVTLRPA